MAERRDAWLSGAEGSAGLEQDQALPGEGGCLCAAGTEVTCVLFTSSERAEGWTARARAPARSSWHCCTFLCAERGRFGVFLFTPALVSPAVKEKTVCDLGDTERPPNSTRKRGLVVLGTCVCSAWHAPSTV